jgi:hypothetical protein
VVKDGLAFPVVVVGVLAVAVTALAVTVLAVTVLADMAAPPALWTGLLPTLLAGRESNHNGPLGVLNGASSGDPAASFPDYFPKEDR